MSPLVIYGVITVSCALILFIMSVFGAEQDIDADIDVDIDVDLDVDADIDVEGLDSAEAAGPGKFSVRLILIFVTGFGASGFVAAYYNCPVHHVIVGLLGGTVAWFGGYEALAWLYRQQSSSQIKSVSFVGKQARVTVPIPKGGTGEVFSRATSAGKSIYFSARAENPKAEHSKGDTVTIKSVDGNTAIVE
jgi:membrane protein implicated in regulation of membrane protease activity